MLQYSIPVVAEYSTESWVSFCFLFLASEILRYLSFSTWLNFTFTKGSSLLSQIAGFHLHGWVVFHCVCMCESYIFIHSSVDRHLGCFHIWLLWIMLIILVLILGGKYLAFYHWVWCVLYVFHRCPYSVCGNFFLFLICWEFLSWMDVRFCQMLFPHHWNNNMIFFLI